MLDRRLARLAAFDHALNIGEAQNEILPSVVHTRSDSSIRGINPIDKTILIKFAHQAVVDQILN